MSEQNNPQVCFRTMIGGQALIEGIMMRGPKKQAIVVRRLDGAYERKVEDLKLVKDRYPILALPFVRGGITFLDSMVKGVAALMWSAEFFPEDESLEESKFDRWLNDRLGSEKATGVIITLAVILGLAFSIGLFFLLPTLLVSGLFALIGLASGTAVGAAVVTPGSPYVMRALLEGCVRIAIFLIYLVLCSRLKDIRRVFSYHGAEHKTIFCYERALPLTVDNVREQPRHHPRCGTSFLFVVIVISILTFSAVFSVFTPPNLLVKLCCQLLLLPLVVGISYEINRYVGRHDNTVTRVLTTPGLWLQNFTTYEPDDSMIEVAIEALTLVLPAEQGEDAW